MISEAKPRKKLYLFAQLIFLLEFLGIIGYYWIFDGHMGDASLTISRYVGLNPWSCAVFCACNVAITVMTIWHIATNCEKRGFIWRFLMYGFALTFLALSIVPHIPDENAAAVTIHRFFAGSMFVAMALIGIYTLIKTRRKWLMLYSTLFVILALFFIICDLGQFDWFLNTIFWYESAFILSFFALTIPEINK